jgi:hypothetical protein
VPAPGKSHTFSEVFCATVSQSPFANAPVALAVDLGVSGETTVMWALLAINEEAVAVAGAAVAAER